MARATRTLNPLHFEDLEPHRFEDLVRQLAYDYRPWASIEATGRSGADDGIDIRAFEPGNTPAPEESDDDDSVPLVGPGRLWIIQCKREKRIGPAQVRRYVEESVQGPDVPHGFILAAACDFSKKAYDAFRLALIGTGVQEFHLWGKAELEDQLFQPKNDHLLFAYFGISLQLKKRTRQTELRSLLTWRKRIQRAFDTDRWDINREVLLVNAGAEDYPVITDVTAFQSAPDWGFFRLRYIHPQNHLVLERRRQLAYANFDTGEWDVLEDSQVPVTREHPYGLPRPPIDPHARARQEAWATFVPTRHHAELMVPNTVHLRDLVAIVEHGDAVHRVPILYIEPVANGELTAQSEVMFLETPTGRLDHRQIRADPEQRVPFFKDFTFEEGDASGG